MNILEKLEREIDRGLDRLATLDPTSDDYATLDCHVRDQMERYAELRRIDDEDKNQSQNRKSENRHRWIGYVITIGSIAGPLWLKHRGLKWAFWFEEKGTIANMPGRVSYNEIFKK